MSISLHINNQIFEGWKSVEVQKSLSQFSGSFGMAISEKYPSEVANWRINNGDECTVRINNQIVMTGFIEEINTRYSAGDHSIQVRGRDKTGDLVDCSFLAEDFSNEWKNISIQEIIEKLCAPFGISVIVDSSVSDVVSNIIDEEAIIEGDPVYDLINKICRTQAILPVSLGDGKLTLTRAGANKAFDNLVSGVNILTGQTVNSNLERFSKYVMKGQGSRNRDEWNLTDTTEPSGTFLDGVITRYRPLVITPDSAVKTEDCDKAIRWEGLNRAGRARTTSYNVQGWQQQNGAVWALNELVSVNDTYFNIQGQKLIAEINFSFSQTSGTITSLVLVEKHTFDFLKTALTEDDGGRFDS